MNYPGQVESAFNSGSQISALGGLTGAIGASAVRQPEIAEQIQRLGSEMSRMAVTIDMLEERFAAVMRGLDPKNIAGNVSKPPAYSQVGGSIGEMADRANALCNRLDEMIQRAEV